MVPEDKRHGGNELKMPVTHAEEIIRKFRDHPVCTNLLPIESRFSLPIPDRRGGSVYLRCLVFNQERDLSSNRVVVYRPFVRFALEYTSGKLVEFAELKFIEGWVDSENAEEIGHYDLGNMPSFQVGKEKRGAFFRESENLLSLIGQPKLSPKDHNSVITFLELLGFLGEPGLDNYYRGLSPDLFSWLEKVI